MAPFDTSHASSNRSFIVSIAPPCTGFQLFDVELYHDFELWVRGHSRSLN